MNMAFFLTDISAGVAGPLVSSSGSELSDCQGLRALGGQKVMKLGKGVGSMVKSWEMMMFLKFHLFCLIWMVCRLFISSQKTLDPPNDPWSPFLWDFCLSPERFLPTKEGPGAGSEQLQTLVQQLVWKMWKVVARWQTLAGEAAGDDGHAELGRWLSGLSKEAPTVGGYWVLWTVESSWVLLKRLRPHACSKWWSLVGAYGKACGIWDLLIVANESLKSRPMLPARASSHFRPWILVRIGHGAVVWLSVASVEHSSKENSKPEPASATNALEMTDTLEKSAFLWFLLIKGRSMRLNLYKFGFQSESPLFGALESWWLLGIVDVSWSLHHYLGWGLTCSTRSTTLWSMRSAPPSGGGEAFVSTLTKEASCCLILLIEAYLWQSGSKMPHATREIMHLGQESSAFEIFPVPTRSHHGIWAA